ncbi:hypothetical protein MHYP_G00231030 [Metynnis hypsauchen]
MPRADWTTPSKTGLQSRTSCTPYRRLEPDWKTQSRTLTRLAHSHGPLPSHHSLPRDTNSKPSENLATAQHSTKNQVKEPDMASGGSSGQSGFRLGRSKKNPGVLDQIGKFFGGDKKRKGKGSFRGALSASPQRAHALLPPPQRRPRRCGAFLQVYRVSCPAQV